MKKGHHSLLICLQVGRKEKYSCGGTNFKIAHVNQSNHTKLQFTLFPRGQKDKTKRSAKELLSRVIIAFTSF